MEILWTSEKGRKIECIMRMVETRLRDERRMKWINKTKVVFIITLILNSFTNCSVMSYLQFLSNVGYIYILFDLR